MMKLELRSSSLILEHMFNHYIYSTTIALQIHLPVSLIQAGSLTAMLHMCDPTILITIIRVRRLI